MVQTIVNMRYENKRVVYTYFAIINIVPDHIIMDYLSNHNKL